MIPVISVIMATYNHADFVKEAIESVLAQEGVEFEFLISDDGSSDHTREVVASVEDARVKFFPNTINRGACVVTNELIKKSKGEFIALINSDDCWSRPDKLALQLQVLNEQPHVGACFGRASYIDSDGVEIDKKMLANGKVFEKKNRSKGQWLRYFFDSGNCICHPTMLIRKSCYQELGGYDNRFRQLPDFDMWVRLIKHHDIYVCDEELIHFRHLPGQNASDSNGDNMRRIFNEYYLILSGFFEGMPDEVFLDGFDDLLIIDESPSLGLIKIEMAFILFKFSGWASSIYKLVGLQVLFNLLRDDSYVGPLKDLYHFDDRAFHSSSLAVGVFDAPNDMSDLSCVRGDSLKVEIFKRFLRKVPNVSHAPLKLLFKKLFHK